MPFRFLFGGRRQQKPPDEKKEDEDDLSEVSLEEFSFFEDPINDVYFMNPGFDAASFRAPSASPVPGLHRRQPTRRLSSRVREYKRLQSVDASEFDVDLALAPSAFALQMIPNGMANSEFCSRDDSEIATRTFSNSPELHRRRSSMVRSPIANPMFLHEAFSYDDSEVGSTTMEKIQLRHMGSALSYRLELSGTPDYSVYEDDESCLSRPIHSRRYSDMSDRLSSFKERNKMIRLESIVGGMQKSEGSVFEFGVLNAEQFANQPTPRLFRSSSEKALSSDDMPKSSQTSQLPKLPPTIDNHRLESYPITFLTDIIEEDEDDNSNSDEVRVTVKDVNKTGDTMTEAEKETLKDDERPPSSLSSLSDPGIEPVIQSSFKVRVAPFEVSEDEGFTNPAFEMNIQPSTADSVEEIQAKRAVYRMESLKRNKHKAKTPRAKTPRNASLASHTSKRRSEKRDESLHIALMERYLVQSVVNKYLVE